MDVPPCKNCGMELTELGGLLFSPPMANDLVEKLHLCKKCWAHIKRNITAGKLYVDWTKQEGMPKV